MGFSNPMQMMMSLIGNKTNPFIQQMPQAKQNSYPPINQQQLINAIPKLSKEDLARVVQQARAQEMSKESKHSEESVENCLWEETHEHIEEWYEEVKKKIDKY